MWSNIWYLNRIEKLGSTLGFSIQVRIKTLEQWTIFMNDFNRHKIYLFNIQPSESSTEGNIKIIWKLSFICANWVMRRQTKFEAKRHIDRKAAWTWYKY